MLANTLTFNYGGSPMVFTRFREQGTSSIYRHKVGSSTLTLTVKQTSYLDKSRNVAVMRHAVDLTTVINPTAPDTTPEVRKAYFVIENDADCPDLAGFKSGLVECVAGIMADDTFQTSIIDSEEY